jgi:voltage-gated potassium channel
MQTVTSVTSVTSEKKFNKNSFFYKIIKDYSSTEFRIWTILINIIIFVSCFSMALETVDEYYDKYLFTFKCIEYVAVTLFALDYLFNVYYADSRIKYVTSFWGVVDFLSILPTLMEVANLTAFQSTKLIRSLRVIRTIRVFKMVKFAVANNSETAKRNPVLINLKIYFAIFFSVIMICSSLMFLVEGSLYSTQALEQGRQELVEAAKLQNIDVTENPDAIKFVPIDPISGIEIAEDKRYFTSIPTAMWWCVLAVTGYGDMFPVTVGGRIVACMTFLLGLTLFGILVIIVGNTIIKLFFIDPNHEETAHGHSREVILGAMTKRGWITPERAAEIELLSEIDIKQKFKSL